MLKNCKNLYAIIALGLMLAWPSYAQEEDEALYKQQSVLIYKFISYFTWPQSVYLENNVKSVTVCILGRDKLGLTLDQLAAGAQMRDKLKINIRRNVSAQDAGSCNIMYISDTAKEEYQQALSSMAKYPVVTVSDIDGFAKSGGIIEFKVKRGKLKFEINKGMAGRQNLKINADLLELAVEVIE